ncbi:MAG: hypothetical protein Q7J08_02660 [Methanocorpusculum sp.]|uniref:hypothetical protein n=1 Tax=Methanocorpusculum sp. TaxID=2058474 RepID=UPI002726AE7E|nr:hypothetical protein [Methanocorpusculum sp.]MDO9522594.1 hypothetical protein [Methanocorpusculum sp.]
MTKSEHSGETLIIREFLGNGGKGKSQLIKEENGRDNCIFHFSSLYGTRDERYSLKVILDNDDGYCHEKLTKRIETEHKNVHLSRISNCRYRLTKSDAFQVFIYPKTLTDSVNETLNENTNFYHGDDDLTQLFTRYLNQAPSWISELESFLLD